MGDYYSDYDALNKKLESMQASGATDAETLAMIKAIAIRDLTETYSHTESNIPQTKIETAEYDHGKWKNVAPVPHADFVDPRDKEDTESHIDRLSQQQVAVIDGNTESAGQASSGTYGWAIIAVIAGALAYTFI